MRRNLVPSRAVAQELVVNGRVTVGGAPAHKPARMVDASESVQLLDPPQRYVSRAGAKLEAGLDRFKIDPQGMHCLDVGSSTGGFTDCLIQRQAASVVAVDVGTNQLHEKVRAHPAVVVYEQADIRSVEPGAISGPFELIVGDLSFISLRLVLPKLIELAQPGAPLVLLVKPQFEAGRKEASKAGGVIADPAIWVRVIEEVASAAHGIGAGMLELMASPVTGTAGNKEFVARLQKGSPMVENLSEKIEAAVAEAEQL